MAYQMAYEAESGNSSEDAVKTHRALTIALLCAELALNALAFAVASLVLLMPAARSSRVKPGSNPVRMAADSPPNGLIKSQ